MIIKWLTMFICVLAENSLNYRLLGSVYAAEALILLNRSNEATNCLAPEFVGAIINSANCQTKSE